ncbi:MAG: AAA family ATPase [Candidatus Hodarchaeales archaeon]|jgi:transitional endoplasmic reticulum ATPase
MVYCEILDSLTGDYGLRIIRLSEEVITLMNIEEDDVVEVIANKKRIGVIVKLESFIETQLTEADSEEETVNEQPTKVTKSPEPDKDLPTPRGRPFRGIASDIEKENVYSCRIDGEVRLSLNANIGDFIEVDTILKPKRANRVYFAVLGMDPRGMAEEERHFLFDHLKLQRAKPISSGLILDVNYAFKTEKILIQATDPDSIVLCTKSTEFELIDTFVPKIRVDTQTVTYEQIGGLKNVIQRLRKLVEVPIRRPEVFNSINLTPPKGILLAGPTGIGKSLLLKALATETEARVIEVPPNLFAGVGPTEKNIRDLFTKVKKEARKKPILLVLDNMESLTPAPYLNIPHYIKRFTVQFALGFDSLKGTNTIIIGACHSTDNIDPIMRRPGRFDVEIECSVPSEVERYEILKIHLRTVPLGEVTEDVLKSFTKRMIGFVGADIAAFVKEACMRSVSRFSGLFNVWGNQIPPSILRMVKVNQDDFEEAFKSIEPSARRSIHSKIEQPDITFDDIGGLDDIKQILREQIKWQFESPEILKSMGVKPSRGMLLYGPPGTGKTLLAKAVATEIQANFIAIKGPELLSVWFGESAKMIRELFSRAQKISPCILFFDEIDAMVPRRGGDVTEGGREIDSTVNQLLTLLDGMGVNQGIYVMGATNRPSALDLALLRPGRLDKLILIPSPDILARKEILEVHTRNVPIEGDRNQLLNEISEETEDFSGADLENLVREAVLSSLRENFEQRIVNRNHFLEALDKVTPSVDAEIVEKYIRFSSEVLGVKSSDISPKKPITYG